MAAAADACEIARLPEELLSAALALASPLDACRAAAVSRAFRAAADSDAVWSCFLPRDLPPLAPGELSPAPPSKKERVWLDRETGAKCYMLSATGAGSPSLAPGLKSMFNGIMLESLASMEAAATCDIARLPEELLKAVISLTAPPDACRAAAVSRAFRAAADSDDVWSCFLPRDLPPIAAGELNPAPRSKKEMFVRLAGDFTLLADGLREDRRQVVHAAGEGPEHSILDGATRRC
ncbi:hypothetical protein ACP70R_028000 [Stipagrostis hirtigluma subsp. patula]